MMAPKSCLLLKVTAQQPPFCYLKTAPLLRQDWRPWRRACHQRIADCVESYRYLRLSEHSSDRRGPEPTTSGQRVNRPESDTSSGTAPMSPQQSIPTTRG